MLTFQKYLLFLLVFCLYQITANAQLTTAPTLTAPDNGAVNVAPTPTFTWDALDGANSYYLQVATDSLFANTVINLFVYDSLRYTPTVPLSPATLYYWRLQGFSQSEGGPWSETRSFTTIEITMNTDGAVEIPATSSRFPPSPCKLGAA